jgi:RimJ/RimL family protein N-acetyltransferase
MSRMTLASQAPPVAGRLGDVLTRRLDLRRFVRTDIDAIAAVFEKPEVWAFPYGRGFTREESEVFVEGQVGHWDELGYGCWVARVRETGRVIGFVGLAVPTFCPEILPAVEIGWRLDPEAWGHGYATEAATAALDGAFTVLGLSTVCSLPQAENPASARVAGRLGMSLRRAIALPPTERRGGVEALLYEITAEAWRRRPA